MLRGENNSYSSNQQHDL